MSEWSDRTNQSLSRVYKAEGAPLQAWQWALVLAGVYLLYKSVNVVSNIWNVSSNTSMNSLREEEQTRIDRKEQLTHPTVQYPIFADDIQASFAVGPGGIFESGPSIVQVFQDYIMTDRDLLRLLIVYGARRLEWQTASLTLLQSISRLTPEIIGDLNEMFVKKGITIRI